MHKPAGCAILELELDISCLARLEAQPVDGQFHDKMLQGFGLLESWSCDDIKCFLFTALYDLDDEPVWLVTALS